MLKNQQSWTYAGPLLLALVLAATFVACERQTDFDDSRITDVGDNDYGINPGDLDRRDVTPSRRDALGVSPGAADRTMPQAGPPPMDGASTAPSDSRLGDTMRTPSQAPMDDTQGAARSSDVMGDTVNITLTASEIQIPDTLPAGSTTFNITNTGNEQFDFEITGQGVEAMLEKPVQPGESESLTVDLKPGKYTVKTEDGMEKEITVTPDGAPVSQ